jgi:hypothetical protein
MSTKLQECSYCDKEYENIESDPHECECGTEITPTACKDASGLCQSCFWLVDK